MSDSPIRRAALAMPNIRERAKSRAPLSDVERQSLVRPIVGQVALDAPLPFVHVMVSGMTLGSLELFMPSNAQLQGTISWQEWERTRQQIEARRGAPVLAEAHFAVDGIEFTGSMVGFRIDIVFGQPVITAQISTFRRVALAPLGSETNPINARRVIFCDEIYDADHGTTTQLLAFQVPMYRLYGHDQVDALRQREAQQMLATQMQFASAQLVSSVTIGGIPMAVVARTMMSCGANSPHIDVFHVSGIRAGDIVIGNGAISSPWIVARGQTLVVQMDAAEGDMLRVWLNRRTLASVQGGEVLFCRPYEPTVPPVAKAAAIPTGGRVIRPNRQLKSPHRG